MPTHSLQKKQNDENRRVLHSEIRKRGGNRSMGGVVTKGNIRYDLQVEAERIKATPLSWYIKDDQFQYTWTHNYCRPVGDIGRKLILKDIREYYNRDPEWTNEQLSKEGLQYSAVRFMTVTSLYHYMHALGAFEYALKISFEFGSNQRKSVEYHKYQESIKKQQSMQEMNENKHVISDEYTDKENNSMFSNQHSTRINSECVDEPQIHDSNTDDFSRGEEHYGENPTPYHITEQTNSPHTFPMYKNSVNILENHTRCLRSSSEINNTDDKYKHCNEDSRVRTRRRVTTPDRHHTRSSKRITHTLENNNNIENGVINIDCTHNYQAIHTHHNNNSSSSNNNNLTHNKSNNATQSNNISSWDNNTHSQSLNSIIDISNVHKNDQKRSYHYTTPLDENKHTHPYMVKFHDDKHTTNQQIYNHHHHHDVHDNNTKIQPPTHTNLRELNEYVHTYNNTHSAQYNHNFTQRNMQAYKTIFWNNNSTHHPHQHHAIYTNNNNIHNNNVNNNIRYNEQTQQQQNYYNSNYYILPNHHLQTTHTSNTTHEQYNGSNNNSESILSKHQNIQRTDIDSPMVDNDEYCTPTHKQQNLSLLDFSATSTQTNVGLNTPTLRPMECSPHELSPIRRTSQKCVISTQHTPTHTLCDSGDEGDSVRLSHLFFSSPQKNNNNNNLQTLLYIVPSSPENHTFYPDLSSPNFESDTSSPQSHQDLLCTHFKYNEFCNSYEPHLGYRDTIMYNKPIDAPPVEIK